MHGKVRWLRWILNSIVFAASFFFVLAIAQHAMKTSGWLRGTIETIPVAFVVAIGLAFAGRVIQDITIFLFSGRFDKNSEV